MRSNFVIFAAALMLLTAFGCSEAVIEAPAQAPPEDLIPYEPDQGKGDGFGFDPHHLIEDAVFEDYAFLSQPQIQAFLESTPYNGRRSFLASYVDDGKSVSALIVASAERWQINPLVLLTKLQVESSAVFKETVPTTHQLDRAMGCGCPDNDPSCGAAPKGLANQIDCAARLFRMYLTELESRSQTRSGWRVGRAKETLDPESITPRNAATAALYTYTPWVLRNEGGNWLFWNVYNRFARKLLEDRPNHRFIGGPCTDDGDCQFENAICLFQQDLGEGDTSDDELEQVGVCSQPCERACPDRSQPNTAITFCAAIGGQGYCLSRCDESMFITNDGCQEGLSCIEAKRPSDESRTQSVCRP